MIIWQGFGFIVPVVGVASMVVTQVLVNAVAQNKVYYQTHTWPKLAGVGLAAALVYGLACTLDSMSAEKAIDPDTGRELAVKPTHSFFFIPIKYWAGIFVILGVVYFVRH